MPVPRVRTCMECKKTFLSPESFRTHKYRFGTCRSPEALLCIGFAETPKGWKLIDPGKARQRQG